VITTNTWRIDRTPSAEAEGLVSRGAGGWQEKVRLAVGLAREAARELGRADECAVATSIPAGSSTRRRGRRRTQPRRSAGARRRARTSSAAVAGSAPTTSPPSPSFCATCDDHTSVARVQSVRTSLEPGPGTPGSAVLADTRRLSETLRNAGLLPHSSSCPRCPRSRALASVWRPKVSFAGTSVSGFEA
jgi:hypothetical protein